MADTFTNDLIEMKEQNQYTLFVTGSSALAGALIGVTIGAVMKKQTNTRIIFAVTGFALFGTSAYLLRRKYLKDKGWI